MRLRLQRGGRALQGDDSVNTPGPGWLGGLSHGQETGGSCSGRRTGQALSLPTAWERGHPQRGGLPAPSGTVPGSRYLLPQEPLGRPSWPLSWSPAKATPILLVLWGHRAACKPASEGPAWGPFYEAGYCAPGPQSLLQAPSCPCSRRSQSPHLSAVSCRARGGDTRGAWGVYGDQAQGRVLPSPLCRGLPRVTLHVWCRTRAGHRPAALNCFLGPLDGEGWRGEEARHPLSDVELSCVRPRGPSHPQTSPA